MQAGELLQIGGVAAADHARDRNACLEAGLEHVALAALQALAGQRQPAEPVVDVRIDAGVEEHQVGAHVLEQARQMVASRAR